MTKVSHEDAYRVEVNLCPLGISRLDVEIPYFQ